MTEKGTRGTSILTCPFLFNIKNKNKTVISLGLILYIKYLHIPLKMSIFVHESRQGLDSLKINSLTLQQTKNMKIMKNFAETVYNYFNNRMQQTGEPLNETESLIFIEAQKRMGKYPIIYLSAESLKELNYIVTENDEKKLPLLAESLETECKEWYTDLLDNMAYSFGFVRSDAYEMMVEDYETRLSNGAEMSSISLIIKYKDQKIPETAIVALGENVNVDAGQIMNVKNLEELKPYFDKDNRYGFYIIEHIDFL